jgi:hypothetical protein
LPTPVPPTKALAGPRYLTYQKKNTREETVLATLRGNGFPTLEGKWYYIGPFGNPAGEGFHKKYPPETEIDLKKAYPAKAKTFAAWQEYRDFRVGKINNLRLFDKDNEDACVYLFHEIEVKEPIALPVSLGSDDTLTVWLNGEQLLANNVHRGAAPDQDFATLHLRAGKNRLLVKVCNGKGNWAFYICPLWPRSLQAVFQGSLARDFPGPP